MARSLAIYGRTNICSPAKKGFVILHARVDGTTQAWVGHIPPTVCMYMMHTVSSFWICQQMSWQHLNQPFVAG